MRILKGIAEGRRKHGLRIFARRWATKQINRVLSRVDRKSLTEAFAEIGLEPGAIVCVHSSLSRLGYVEGHAETVIDALMETVTPSGTIMMPSFPSRRSMLAVLKNGEVFDVRGTPSRVGAITESFRLRAGVLRSRHPTNPVAAWGADAAWLLQDHECSKTPYGPQTPYGRLADLENSFILMLGTHLHSFLHHLQERVALPTLFLTEEQDASFIDEKGRRCTMRTRVMRPNVAYFIAIPAARGPEPDWAILHDFVLMFPRSREAEVRGLGYHFDGYPRLHQRRHDLKKRGVLKTTRVGRTEVGLVHVRGLLEFIEPEFRALIERFRPYYDPDRIAALELPYS